LRSTQAERGTAKKTLTADDHRVTVTRRLRDAYETPGVTVFLV
jgi:hypothetical protein